MQRSRLKNIINKSKQVSKSVDDFDNFKESLPKQLDYYKDENNYRLKAAWKAYGKPKNYQEALWEGLVQPIDNETFKMPSIGYNEENEDYEYLNKGKENEIVAKDIRVWDNDVIPLVKELKLGGYVRTFNEEKDCWIYSKNSQKETSMGQESSSIQQTKSEEINSFKEGGQMSVIPEGALHARKNEMELAKEGTITHKGIPVVDNEGEQQAEIERNEIIFRKQVTDKMEELYKKYNDAESQSKKDEIAIEMGKIITCEITKHTEDRTGLIEQVQEGM